MRFLIALFAVTTLAYAQPDSLHVIWDKRGAGEESHFGIRVYALGDQNGDGYADFTVVSSGAGAPGQINEPRFDLFHGGNPPDSIPDMTFKGRQLPYRELWEAQTIGDINSDGYTDWWAGYGFGAQNDSMEYEFHWGGPSADTIPDFIFRFTTHYGHSWIEPVGDINGDGHADFFLYDAGVDFSVDVTYIYYGGDPPDTLPHLIIHSNPVGSQNSLPRAFGDLNGDGYGDFLTATNYVHPTTYVYFGGNSPDTLPDYTWPDFRVDRVIISPSLNGERAADLIVGRSLRMDVHFGGSVLSPIPNYTLTFPGCDLGPTEIDYAGDLNGDGYGDVVAISDCNDGFGGLRLYLGHPWLNTDPVLWIDGATMPLDLIGICHAAGLGDVNGDAIEDLVIGATNDMTFGQGRRGRAVIISGDTTLHVGAHEHETEIPRDFAVTIFPNPFNSQTTITLDLPGYSAEVHLKIFNLLGQVVFHTTLHNVIGSVRYGLNGEGLSSGIYLLNVSTGRFYSTHKLVVLK